jgi:hypothetical protein
VQFFCFICVIKKIKFKIKKIQLISIYALLVFACIGCSDDSDDSTQVSSPNEITTTVTSGEWVVTFYEEDGIEQTSDFSGYDFTFASNGDLSATNGMVTQLGVWSTYTDSGQTKLDLQFTAISGPFQEINEDWRVISRTATKIELRDVSGDGSVDLLTFEKNI